MKAKRVYLIDEQKGDYQSYSSMADAAKALDISAMSISSALKNEGKVLGRYSVTYTKPAAIAAHKVPSQVDEGHGGKPFFISEDGTKMPWAGKGCDYPGPTEEFNRYQQKEIARLSLLSPTEREAQIPRVNAASQKHYGMGMVSILDF